MTFITIDETKCKRDGLCVNECPLMLIAQPEPKAVPLVNPKSEAFCLECGHCVAVCPHGALSHKAMKEEDCLKIRPGLMLDTNQVEQFLRSRRAVRAFESKEVDKNVIEKLINLANYAPTAHNDEEVEWLVISGIDHVKKFTGMVIDSMRDTIAQKPDSPLTKTLNMIVGGWDLGFDAVSRNAPHLIVAHADSALPPHSKYHAVDCATALAYLELAAPSHGVATCWNGLFQSNIEQWKPLKDALGIPEKNRCHGVLMLGYPTVKYHRLPLRKPSKVIWNQADPK
jgi:nitroreductase/NAD-dependent dihydropyrimidine dehydrogenase PreA subunit